jgi:hypothetical protein
MSEIPTITISEFKLLKVKEIKEMKSCEIISDGEYLCTVVIPPKNGGITITDHIRARAEQAGFSGNSVGGKEYSHIKGG